MWSPDDRWSLDIARSSFQHQEEDKKEHDEEQNENKKEEEAKKRKEEIEKTEKDINIRVQRNRHKNARRR